MNRMGDDILVSGPGLARWMSQPLPRETVVEGM